MQLGGVPRVRSNLVQGTGGEAASGVVGVPGFDSKHKERYTRKNSASPEGTSG
jgi:hypothetical protein